MSENFDYGPEIRKGLQRQINGINEREEYMRAAADYNGDAWTARKIEAYRAELRELEAERAALKRQMIASRWTTDPSAIPVRAWQSDSEYFLIGSSLTLRMNKANELRAFACDVRADHWFDPAMGFSLAPVDPAEAAALIERTNTRWNLVFSL